MFDNTYGNVHMYLCVLICLYVCIFVTMRMFNLSVFLFYLFVIFLFFVCLLSFSPIIIC